jgi:hypothetical protein
MKSSSRKPPARRKGKGYRLGPRKPPPIPDDATWISSIQVCNRYGGRSQMWLHRNLKEDPAFPKPVYFGRLRMFSVAALDAYDRAMLSKRVGGES